MDDDAATRRVTWITLLTSTGTLICCALPALLVAIGAGAALAFAASAVPQLVWISEHKELVFGLASAMLIAAMAGTYIAVPNGPGFGPSLHAGQGFFAQCLSVCGDRVLSRCVFCVCGTTA
jgi:hypothetical protein